MRSLQKQSPKPGVITALLPQKKQNRTSIFVDDQFAIGVWTDLVHQYELHVGKTLSQDLLDLLINHETASAIRATALKYLSYSSRTEFQIRKRLHREGYSTLEITPVIDELIDLGYIDDRKYAIEYAQARFKHKGFGPNRIRRELIADGVCHEFISEAIKFSASSDDLIESAKKNLDQFQNRVHGTVQERRKKLIGCLIRRGYDSSLAQELVQEVLRQSDSDQ